MDGISVMIDSLPFGRGQRPSRVPTFANAAPAAHSRAKLALDAFLSALLLAILAPLFGMIAAAIKLTSSGPVFFIQERVGYQGTLFGMFKFRTMYDGADAVEADLAVARRDRTFFKIDDDPRVTPLGRWLRIASLDELPQLYNVLRGDMSLVGPRPILLSDFLRFPRGHQMRRFTTKPGITGLWQVSGRSLVSDAQRIELDLVYVDCWSLGLDAVILARTVPAVLSGQGAC